MIIIIIKFIHYLAIVFSGGVLVGSGLIQSIYNKENKVPDITISKILKMSPVKTITFVELNKYLAHHFSPA